MQERLFTAASLVCVGILGLSILSYCGGKFVMDDALMFARYANNALSAGSVSWNPGDSATYGPTSLAFLGVITLLSALLSAGPYTIVQAASCGLGIVFLFSLATMVIRESDDDARPLMFLVTAAGLGTGATFLSAQFMTGMDTTLAMCSVSLLILLWRGATHRSPLAAGLVGGILLLVRPDLLLISVGVPVVVWLTGEEQSRAYWRSCLAVTLITLATLLLSLMLTFGTPVPLSVYAKVFSPYGQEFRAVYRSMPFKQSVNFVTAYWILFALAAGLMMLNGRALLEKRNRFVLAIAGVVAAWFVYLLGVTQIMAYRGRFYHPVLPCVVFLVLWGSAQSFKAYKQWFTETPRMVGVSVCLLLLGSVSREGVSVIHELRSHLRLGYVGEMSVLRNYDLFWADFWYALPEILDVSPELSVATTEVGLPGVMHPDGRVIDLAGLNDTEIARNGFRANHLLNERKPDVIYMPHPHYVSLNRALTQAAGFASYKLFPKDMLGAEMDVAIRRNSPFAETLYSLMPERSGGI